MEKRHYMISSGRQNNIGQRAKTGNVMCMTKGGYGCEFEHPAACKTRPNQDEILETIKIKKHSRFSQIEFGTLNH